MVEIKPKCNICSSNIDKLFSATVLRKYEISYYKCSNCGFIQTEEPYWLNEAYNLKNTYLDTGYVSRNINFSHFTEQIINKYFNANNDFLDYGSGYGLFVRLMRDKGFNYYWNDKYASNVFSFGFEGYVMKNKKYELLTAYEVFEHLPNPIAEVENMFQYSNSILFSTLLQPNKKINDIKDWWYFVPEGGQHISFFTLNALKHLANKFEASLYTNGGNIHLLCKYTNKKIKLSAEYYAKCIKSIERILGINRLKKKSLTQSDYILIKNKIENGI